MAKRPAAVWLLEKAEEADRNKRGTYWHAEAKICKALVLGVNLGSDNALNESQQKFLVARIEQLATHNEHAVVHEAGLLALAAYINTCSG